MGPEPRTADDGGDRDVRVLIVEDRPTDAELMEREIDRAGIRFVSRRVKTAEALLAALEEFEPDVILSDYVMPSFTGLEALELTLKHAPLAPFIIVTGSVDEETAVACIQAGAIDYVIKENLARLGTAVANALMLARERTERAHAQEALRHSEDMLRQARKLEAVGQLAGGVAHDFNNLITAIVGYAELVCNKMDADDPRRRDIEEIQAAADRASTLTQQLLAFSRNQALDPAVLPLNEVVHDMERMLRRIIGEDMELETDLESEPALVFADRGQVEQVIMNLAVNARDAMPKGGKLTIETRDVELDIEYAAAHPDANPGPHVLLAISDTGEGMDAATRERIFEPFFTTKERGKGTGLGLATVYGIVRQSEGHVYVYSEPGAGTTFKIYFPCAEGDEEPVRPTWHAHGAGELGGRETVLLVEDDEAVRTLAQRILEHHGYRVLETTSVEEALELGSKHPERIHLLLSDVVMPQMNGPTLAKRLAELRPDMRVLFMSGYSDHGVFRQGALERGLGYIAKPFTAAQLARKVRSALDADLDA